MKILISSFDPFGGEQINAAEETLKAMPDKVGEHTLVKVILPTVFGHSFEILKGHIEEQQPDAVICLGQAKGRPALTIERIALNLNDASIPDNAGNQPKDQAIDPEGDLAMESLLPVKAMVEAANDAGTKTAVSLSAGAFVCNDILYRLTQYGKAHGIIGGFVHVPACPKQEGDCPKMPTEAVVKGLQAAISVLGK